MLARCQGGRRQGAARPNRDLGGVVAPGSVAVRQRFAGGRGSSPQATGELQKNEFESDSTVAFGGVVARRNAQSQKDHGAIGALPTSVCTCGDFLGRRSSCQRVRVRAPASAATGTIGKTDPGAQRPRRTIKNNTARGWHPPPLLSRLWEAVTSGSSCCVSRSAPYQRARFQHSGAGRHGEQKRILHLQGGCAKARTDFEIIGFCRRAGCRWSRIRKRTRALLE